MLAGLVSKPKLGLLPEADPLSRDGGEEVVEDLTAATFSLYCPSQFSLP